jgi:hypothetical protein
MDPTPVDRVTTIRSKEPPNCDDPHNGAIDERELEAVCNAEPDHAAAIAFLIDNESAAEAEADGIADTGNADMENADLNELVEAVDPSNFIIDSPSTIAICPPLMMHPRQAPVLILREGVTTRAAAVLASIEKAPDTGDRVSVKRRANDAMRSARVLPFGDVKQSRYS